MVAPMMGWTTRHYRYFFRLICKKAQLYTEMLTTGAILNNPQREHLLAFHASEKALAIQLAVASLLNLPRRLKWSNLMVIQRLI